MNAPRRSPATLMLAGFLCLVLLIGARARESQSGAVSKKDRDPQRILVLDGSPVHNVGNLQLHTGNWGAFGSMPGSGFTFSHAPSAQWPAGSGVEYLYVAGLWVGANKDGVPAVSTSAYAMEFRPTQSPIDIVYYAMEGSQGGNRLPDPNADDDLDGMIDEEWLDGHDQDLDGFVDEDFAAISDQMLSCWYTDDQPEAIQIYPEHNPLHLLVRQNSYQWSDSRFDDFVGFDYMITNTGVIALTDVYVGLFVDGDAGSRDTDGYYEDDASDFLRYPMLCTSWGSTSVEFAYVYDADGDMGMTTGYCGVLLLDHTTDPSGANAPEEVGFCTYAVFAGTQPYDDGGDPTNDFERYELMSNEVIESGHSGPADVRYLVCVGPFAELPPGESLTFSVALFAGNAAGGSISDVLNNAAVAKLTYEGCRYNLDANPWSGVRGRETPVYGPATDVVVDACESPPIVVPSVGPGEVVWVNADCELEELRRDTCGYAPEDSAWFRTGIFGREGLVNWVLPSKNLVPVFVTQFDAKPDRHAAVLEWDVVADEPLRGFKVYRSAGDTSPLELPSVTGLLPQDSRSFTDSDVVPGKSYRYTLQAILEDGTELNSRTVETTIPALTTTLHQNYPNPFNPATTISFTLAETGPVTVSIFTPEGKLVTTLVDDVLPAGFNEIPWDGRDTTGNAVTSGIYLYRLKADKRMLSQKMILLK